MGTYGDGLDVRDPLGDLLHILLGSDGLEVGIHDATEIGARGMSIWQHRHYD